MNIMKRLTWRSLWLNKTRTVVTIIGVVLSAALFMAVTTAAYSVWDFMVRGYEYESGDWFVSFDHATDRQYADAQADPAVKRVADLKIIGYASQFDKISPSGTYEIGAMGENFPQQMSVPLVEGRLPENSREIVIPEIYLSLRNAGKEDAPKIGDKLTLSLFFSWQENPESDENPDVPEETVAIEYTVVGIMKDRNYRPNTGNWGYNTILTVADGSEGATLWHRLFLKTEPGDAKAVSQRSYGNADIHTELLNINGFTGEQNTTLTILLMAAILLLIVMLASVSLISNAFSVSVAERTKQFGLLASIGATRKQIRASVRFEAAILMTLGISAGVLVGYGAIAILFRFYGKHLARLFSFSVNGGVHPYAAFSILAVLAAVLICALTIWISAWIPSARAARTAPLEAIRQRQDYKTNVKRVRVNPLTVKLFGVPGFIGAKYYMVSRRKYRPIVIALVFSMVLFVFSAYFSDQMDMTADAQGAEDYDFSVSCSQDNRLQVYEKLRSSESVEKSALVCGITMTGILETADLHDKYKAVQESSSWGHPQDYSGRWCTEQVELSFLEDDVFIAHLEKEGIDPAPYLEEGSMLGVTVKQTYGGWAVQNEAGQWTEMRFYGHALAENAGTVSCIEPSYHLELKDFGFEQGSGGLAQPMGMSRSVTRDGKIVLHMDGASFIEDITEEVIDGKHVVNYYSYHKETGEIGSEILLSVDSFAPQIEVAAQLEEVPYGISTQNGSIHVVLPLSKLPQEIESNYLVDLCMDAADYQALLAELKAFGHHNIRFAFTDYNESQMNMRGIVTLLRVFSTGFIVLISLIACANVLTTISTGVALRRKDYGVLRSMGFTQKHLYQLMVYECMCYGGNAIMWSVPLSMGLLYGLYRVTNLSYSTDFEPPWDVFIRGICLILAVLFVSAVYAIFSIRKDNPIDAIRTENT